MKQKLMRVSKSTLSVVLALMMLLSTSLVGMISTTAAVIEDDTAVGANAKIYFDNSSDNWQQVAIWAWKDSTNYTGGQWPGKTMTNEGNNVWSYNLDTNANTVIFNNNNNGLKTSNLQLPDDWATNPVIYKNGKLFYKNSGAEVIIGQKTPTYYLKGGFNGWNLNNQIENGKTTLTITAGSYEFKVMILQMISGLVLMILPLLKIIILAH